MATINPVDTSSFTPTQLAAYNNAASLAPVAPTITSNSLQGTIGIRLPSTPPDNTNYSGMIGTGNALAGVGSTQTDTSTPDPYKLLLDRLDNTTPPPSAADQYNTDYASSGIDAKQATVNASKQKLSTINAQLAAITADVSKQQLQAASNPGDQQFQVERTQQQIARDAAIQAIPLQAQAMATQAELTNNTDLLDQAQTHLDKVFAIHAQDAENQYNYKQKLYDTIYDFANKQQQAIIDKKKTEDAQNFQIQRDAINNQQALSRYATEQGQGTLAAQIGALDPKSPTYTHDLATLQSKIVPKASVSGDTGGVTTLTGKPQTTIQATANGYGDRLNQSNIVIDQLGSKFTGSLAIGGSLPNVLQSGDRQSYEQAKRNFVTAVLRRESGAAISDSEFATEAKKYFPQAGDKPEVVIQKAAARNTAINNVYREANVARPVLPGMIIESAGVKYRVSSDGETLEKL